MLRNHGHFHFYFHFHHIVGFNIFAIADLIFSHPGWLRDHGHFHFHHIVSFKIFAIIVVIFLPAGGLRDHGQRKEWVRVVCKDDVDGGDH